MNEYHNSELQPLAVSLPQTLIHWNCSSLYTG